MFVAEKYAVVPSPIDVLIEQRSATERFDPDHHLSQAEIEQLASLATRAPSAYNLQNWHLHAVRTPGMKARLRALAYHQAKVGDAAVTFVVSGEIARPDDLVGRLAPVVEAGQMSERDAASWTDQARHSYSSPRSAQDEAIRSATLLASTLMFAAEGRGLATAPMSGFDPSGVQSLLGLPPEFTPVLLVAIGRPLPGNPGQKPRRPLSDVLTLA